MFNSLWLWFTTLLIKRAAAGALPFGDVWLWPYDLIGMLLP